METNAAELGAAQPADRRFIDVAVDGQTFERERLLTYGLPGQFIGSVEEHQLVWVPLRKQLRLAIVVRIHGEKPDFAVREMHAPVEPSFRLAERQWELIELMSRQTLCSLFEAASLFLPPGVQHRSVEHLRLRSSDAVDGESPEPRSGLQAALIELLQAKGEVSLNAARQALGSSLTTVIDRLEREGVIERVARVTNRAIRVPARRYVAYQTESSEQSEQAEPAIDLSRAPAQRRALEVVRRRVALNGGRPIPWDDLLGRQGVTANALYALRDRGVLAFEEVQVPPTDVAASDGARGGPQLSPAQSTVWKAILRAMRSPEPTQLLLHGVTGSGKTELYLRAAAWSLSHGRQVIILVPEIALATQVVARFAERFPGRVAVLHSALSDGERYQTWQAIAAGHLPIVVGPRSALFAPFDRLGLIVIDEEHESAYKQDAPPRYHARTVAWQLAQQSGATVLMGSATPDAATYQAALSGEVQLLSLHERVGPFVVGRRGQLERRELSLPSAEVVDMRMELKQGNTSLFSRALQGALEEALAAGEQSILFLNRRGMSTFVQCRDCGYVANCPYCDIPMTYHGDLRLLICHRCNERRALLRTCPECGSRTVGYYGTGTQRVESAVKQLLPGARVLRWDQDTLKRGVDHRTMIERVLRRDVDVVVGTQMVAKGLDFPGVSTIGVMSADTMLHLPDFRSGERTFQMLTQVAGRAGRRAPGGRVIIQSFTPDHYAILAAEKQDYQSFIEQELPFRREHGYPPFRPLILLRYRHSDEVACELAANEVAEQLARVAYALNLRDVDLVGPTPAFTAKIRGRYQWQIFVRGAEAHAAVAALTLDPGWTIDVDPISTL